MLTLLQALGIPALMGSVILLWIQRMFKNRDAEAQKHEEEEKKREAARQKNNVLLIRMVGAAIALGEATAHAVQLGHPNGDMEAALEYAQQVKHEQKDFLTEQSQKNIA